MKRTLMLATLAAMTMGGCPLFGTEATNNDQPTARILVEPQRGTAPLTVSLDGRTSTDVDGSLIEFNWRFGDGTGPVNSPTGVYTYTQPGTYKISLTVVDDAGGESTDEFDLIVE